MTPRLPDGSLPSAVLAGNDHQGFRPFDSQRGGFIQHASQREEHYPAAECLDATEIPLVRVLAVEDARSDLLMLENALAGVPSVRFDVTAVSHVRDAVTLLGSVQFDVVLTDLGLADSSGLDTFLTLRAAAPRLPVIVITGTNDERMGIRAMREGAYDYFVKGHFVENGLIRSIRDAIERRRAEEAKERDVERFRASIESLLDGFVLLSPVREADETVVEFKVDYINAAGLSCRPGDPQAPAPLSLSELFPESTAPGLFEDLLRVHGTGEPCARESALFRERSSDYAAPCYDFRATSTRDCVALSWRDVTERLRLEAQILQAQKMSSIGQLAGGIAHDFNNLLTVIHGHADRLGDSRVLAPALLGSITEISAAAQRATTLTRQLLTFSRQQPLIAADVDLNDTVAQMSNMLGRILGESIRLRVEFRQPPPHVRADRGMIEQLLLNFAVNSRDAMPGGGELAITTTVCTVREEDLISGTRSRRGCSSVSRCRIRAAGSPPRA